MEKGSSFTLSLPIHQTQIEPLPPKAGSTSFTFLTSPLIVVVDDDKDVRDGMSALLTGWNCQVICTATGEDATSLLSNTTETPTLLIIDKRLANDENGIDVIERIREEVNETTPALLMTGDISGFDEVTNETSVQIMHKPVEPNEIKRTISDLITSSDRSNQA